MRGSDPEREDWVPADDAVIGRAFRRSALALALLAVVVVAVWLGTRSRSTGEIATAKNAGAVIDRPTLAEPPAARLVDTTAASGIDFLHRNGARGEKLLPETMGGGVAFLDHDADGDQDLLLVHSAPDAGGALYRNDGRGRFADVTRESGLDAPIHGMGVAVADYDNDGDADLFLTALGPNRLLENRAGRFVDVTAMAGVAGDPGQWSTSAGFFDYDNDGDLDLFVCNYVRWTRAIDFELNFTLNGRDRAYGPPTHYTGMHPRLYRNEGRGRFRDVSAEAGIEVANSATGLPVAKALGVTFADVDGDGWLEVFVANDTVQNFLFRNRRDGTFEELGATAGVGFDAAGNATGAMGIDAAWYRNDDALAVAIGNFANEMTSFYVAQAGSLAFTDEATVEGIGAPSRLFLSFGLFFFDYDLDGRLDLLQANGHLETEIQAVQASQTYRQPAQLFWNVGPAAQSAYVEVPRERTGDLARPIVGRGAAYADIDADGDLDVVLTQIAGAPLVLRNDLTAGPSWVRLVLRGTRSNRDAIGARVELTAGGTMQRQHVMPTRSYLSQVEKTLTFGLGGASSVDAVRVYWPSGAIQDVGPVPIGTTTMIVED